MEAHKLWGGYLQVVVFSGAVRFLPKPTFSLNDWTESQAVTGTVTFDRLDLDSVSSGWILEGVVILLQEATSCYRNLSVGIHPEVMLPLVELCSIFLDSRCLLGSHLKGKGKGILGGREGWGARMKGGRKKWREAPGGSGKFWVWGKGEGHARKEGGRSRGKHLEGVVILLLEVASCHTNLSGYPVVMLPQVDNLTKMLKRSDIKPVKVFGLSDVLQLMCASDISTNVHAIVGRTREKN